VKHRRKRKKAKQMKEERKTRFIWRKGDVKKALGAEATEQ